MSVPHMHDCVCVECKDKYLKIELRQRIATLAAERDEARRERDALREALTAVEWRGDDNGCPMCGCQPHAPDCIVGKAMAMGGRNG